MQVALGGEAKVRVAKVEALSEAEMRVTEIEARAKSVEKALYKAKG